MSSPIFFDKFGKSTKDIFSKKFNYDQSIKFGIKNPAKDDMNVESTVTFKDNSVSGKSVITGKVIKNTDFEVEVNTGGKSVAKTTYKCDSGNCVVNLKHTVGDPKTNKGALTHTANVDYKVKAEPVSFAGSVNVALAATDTKPSLAASLVTLYKGLNLGASTAYSFENKAVTDYNVGAEFAQGNYQITAKTAKKGESLVVSFFQKVSDRHKASVRLNFTNKFADKCFEVANEFDMDDKTNAVVALDSHGTVEAALVHSYGAFKLTTCATFSASGSESKKVGMGLHFF